MKFRMFSLIFLLVLFQQSQAQEPWTLEKCIKYAIENNIQIKQQNLTVEAAGSSLKQSQLGMLPTLYANGNQQYYMGRTINPYSFDIREDNRRTNSFGINSSVTLFQGLQKLNTMKAYEYNLRASVMNVEKEKNNVILNVAGAYMQILFNEELVKVSENQVVLSKQQEEKTKKRVEAGTQPAGNLLDIQSQLAQDELSLVNAKNQLQQSLLTLTQLLELKTYEGFVIVKPDENVLNTAMVIDSMSLIVDDAMNFLPDVKSAELQLEGYHNSMKAAMGYQSPSLTMSAGYGTYYSNRLSLYSMGAPQQVITGYVNGDPAQPVMIPQPTATERAYPFFDQLSDNRNLTLMFSLNIPIFNGYQIRNNINQSRVNYYRSQNNLELTKKQIYKDIQQVYLSAVAAQKRYAATMDAVNANKEAYRYAEQKLENGIMTPVEFSTVKTKLAKSESDLLQAKYEYVYRSRQLEFYRGKPFQL